MKVVSPSTMREIDRRAIEDFGVPGVVLMENASREVAAAVWRIWERVKDNRRIPPKVAVFCGRGNNGGDGFGAARHLANMGFEVRVFVAADPTEITGDAAVNFEIVRRMGIPVIPLRGENDLEKARGFYTESFAGVDALFGTGLRGEITGFHRKVIEFINEGGCPVVAVDIPSGICGLTGKILGAAVRAEVTVTMGLPKIGLLLYPGASYAGIITLADIGLPAKILDDVKAEGLLLDRQVISCYFKPYAPDAHKGDFGRVFIIAGSKGMTGAAVLAGLGAARCGAGLVTLGVPEGLNDILEVKVTEVMTLPLPQTPAGSLSIKALEPALEFARKCDAVAMGPGLSRHEETAEFVKKFVTESPVPVVIDADGLNALSEYPGMLKKAKAPVVITPHPGEMARLLSITAGEVQENRWDAVREACDRFGCTVVLKGARTLVASPDHPVSINPTGNPGMATGGSGDVLTGMIAALAARGLKCHEAAAAGVYLHGLAGDLAAREKGEIPLIAGDIIDHIHEAFKYALEGESLNGCEGQAHQGRD
ncbi:NAD(P)H-hydrate dehydratase [Thermosediminibacter litoriperuensis]|uniref:Bifunctional NAD(P)H-hydrate repair enzyme n=1 Tax=Thermosediminibacter litoriperuensis TaxID=291989 RepID=A0A5S5ANR5_9FIRM|nr:NAD(P)H-hydrate dehydratase [Thermosediminibacter litoriperuensis]TYP53303.1 NAD(P)H-hydrate epimerase [Thermosediminibacter litoriperuensis]